MGLFWWLFQLKIIIFYKKHQILSIKIIKIIDFLMFFEVFYEIFFINIRWNLKINDDFIRNSKSAAGRPLGRLEASCQSRAEISDNLHEKRWKYIKKHHFLAKKCLFLMSKFHQKSSILGDFRDKIMDFRLFSAYFTWIWVFFGDISWKIMKFEPYITHEKS